MELLDVYNARHERTGRTVVRGGAVSEGERLLAVHTLVLNSRNELLIQKRSLRKDRTPGRNRPGCAFERAALSLHRAVFVSPGRFLPPPLGRRNREPAAAGGRSGRSKVGLAAGSGNHDSGRAFCGLPGRGHPPGLPPRTGSRGMKRSRCTASRARENTGI